MGARIPSLGNDPQATDAAVHEAIQRHSADVRVLALDGGQLADLTDVPKSVLQLAADADQSATDAAAHEVQAVIARTAAEAAVVGTLGRASYLERTLDLGNPYQTPLRDSDLATLLHDATRYGPGVIRVKGREIPAATTVQASGAGTISLYFNYAESPISAGPIPDGVVVYSVLAEVDPGYADRAMTLMERWEGSNYVFRLMRGADGSLSATVGAGVTADEIGRADSAPGYVTVAAGPQVVALAIDGVARTVTVYVGGQQVATGALSAAPTAVPPSEVIRVGRRASASTSRWLGSLAQPTAARIPTPGTSAVTAADVVRVMAGVGGRGAVPSEVRDLARRLKLAGGRLQHYPLTTGPKVRMGMQTWFNGPTALYDAQAGAGGQTLVGYVSSTGVPSVAVHDHATGVATAVPLYTGFPDTDDHDNPGLTQLPDGRYVAIAAHHNGRQVVLRSLTPRDALGGWELVVENTATERTYACVGVVPTEGGALGRLYWFQRGSPNSQRHRAFRHSDDGGQTWSAEIDYLTHIDPTGSIQRCYVHVWQEGARFHILANEGHPNEVIEESVGGVPVSRNSMRHFYVEGGQCYRTDGTLINGGALPIHPQDATLIYDGSATNCWGYEIRKVDGVLVVAFVTYGPPGNANPPDMGYRVGRYVGGAWQTEQVATHGGASMYAAQGYYPAGISIEGPHSFIVCRRVPGGWGVFRIYSIDGGQSYHVDRIERSADHVVRPFVVPGRRDVVYWVGRYSSYFSFDLAMRLVEA